VSIDATRSVRVLVSAVAISTCLLALSEAVGADPVISFDDLAGAVDTYFEDGFQFTGGDVCVNLSCTANGIHGMGNLQIAGAPVMIHVSVQGVTVERLDGGLFDLLAVDLIGVASNPVYIFGFEGYRGNQRVCSVDVDLEVAVPTTLAFPGCEGIDSVFVRGVEASIVTDNWVFALAPEPEASALSCAGLVSLVMLRRWNARSA